MKKFFQIARKRYLVCAPLKEFLTNQPQPSRPCLWLGGSCGSPHAVPWSEKYVESFPLQTVSVVLGIMAQESLHSVGLCWSLTIKMMKSLWSESRSQHMRWRTRLRLNWGRFISNWFVLTGTRWDAWSRSPTDAIRLNGITPITFQTGQPHSHMREGMMTGWSGGGGV